MLYKVLWESRKALCKNHLPFIPSWLGLIAKVSFFCTSCEFIQLILKYVFHLNFSTMWESTPKLLSNLRLVNCIMALKERLGDHISISIITALHRKVLVTNCITAADWPNDKPHHNHRVPCSIEPYREPMKERKQTKEGAHLCSSATWRNSNRVIE